MHTFINSPLQIGSLLIPNRLIQSPLAGYSCSPFRTLFYQFQPPAYSVSEMISAKDILEKHRPSSRYLYRAPQEKILAYQLSGTDPKFMAQAALKLEQIGADIIDINCGCPKTKIRKKGAGSALLEKPQLLRHIIQEVREKITRPLTIKIRLQGSEQDFILAQEIQAAGADALIVHGRHWTEGYDIPCNLDQIRQIKNCLKIPLIANGDIKDKSSLKRAVDFTGCDGFMIGRAGTGKPWLYQELLEPQSIHVNIEQKIALFLSHLEGLAILENEYQAVLQSRSLFHYYFKEVLNKDQYQPLYALHTLKDIHIFLKQMSPSVHL